MSSLNPSERKKGLDQLRGHLTIIINCIEYDSKVSRRMRRHLKEMRLDAQKNGAKTLTDWLDFLFDVD